MLRAASDSVRIVHADRRYVVVDKPSGLLSVPGKGAGKTDCVAARIAAAFPDATGPLIVHRLDMETSGLMVLGLDVDAHRDLSRQFEERTVEKLYLALVCGRVVGDAGVIDAPMRADIDHRPVQVVDAAHGRPAITRWRILSRETDRTRIEFLPLTGRTHQLRVHAAHPRDADPPGLGHAILGDTLYGDAGSAPRLLLHATGLSFREPGSARRVTFRIPAPF